MKLLLALGLTLVAVGLGCSKKNTIDASTDIITGVKCTDLGDPVCGKDGACVLGYCRIPCDSDQDCLQGALCIGTAMLSGASSPGTRSATARCPARRA